MNQNQVIETIIGIFASFLRDNIPPKTAEAIENGQRFTWMVDPQVALIVDQYDDPPNTLYTLKSKKFTLTLFEDSTAQKYKLDAPEIVNDDLMMSWLEEMWQKHQESAVHSQ